MYEITSQTGAELSKGVQRQAGRCAKDLGQRRGVHDPERPGWQRSFVAAFKNAATTGQQAFAQAQAAAQQAMAQAQDHVTDVVAKTVKSAKTAARSDPGHSFSAGLPGAHRDTPEPNPQGFGFLSGRCRSSLPVG